jgi:thiol-disulfide isomerase/thioredoxin
MKITKLLLLFNCLFPKIGESQTNVNVPSKFSNHSFQPAPSSGKWEALKVGDKVPDIWLGEIINSSLKSARISDFKGKLLILDFWSTWCTVCVAQFPKLDSLQQYFGNKITILPIGFELPNAINGIKKFVSQRKGKPNELRLPTVIQKPTDSILIQLFPTTSLPHEVWIDGNGYVIGITDHRPVTKEVIQHLLDHKSITFPSHIYDATFNKWEPLLIDGNGGADTAFAFRSLITKYNPSIAGVGKIQTQDETRTRILAVNVSLLSLLKIGFSRTDSIIGKVLPYDYLNKNFILENPVNPILKDWAEMNNKDYLETLSFNNENLFCYELILPPSFSLKEANEIMIKDIAMYFQIKPFVEKRKVKCLKLIISGKVNKASTNSPKNEQISENFLSYSCSNCAIGNLVKYMNSFYHGPIIIDSTHLTENINIDLQLSTLYDLEHLKVQLNKSGLSLAETEAELPMIVIPSSKIKSRTN